ncbi:HlyIII-domain-containing protein [Ceratobasidium sp. AG-I]|nr:HlyIII-domain-containing protein [Ceratobasidium sp. AG-I]
MEVPRPAQGARRLSVPAIQSFRPLTQRTRSNIIRRRRQPLSRAALKSLAPLNLAIPASATVPPPLPETSPSTSLYFVVLSHLADLEARLHTSSSALELLHKLRDEVAAYFPSLDEDLDANPVEDGDGPDTRDYDFEYDFGLRAALDFDFGFGSALDLDLDLNLRSHYAVLLAELSTLSMDEAKNKLYELSTLGYDDAKSRFGALGERLEDAKNRLVGGVRRWADDTIPTLPTIPSLPNLSNIPALQNIPALPNMPALPMEMPDLHARLAELRAALPADLSNATDRLVAFVEGLIEDDADGNVSWVDTRWKGLNTHPKNDEVEGKGKQPAGKPKVDMHALALGLSEGGRKLIRYCDLPEKWKNNEFVTRGYRFIPGSQWPALALSVFQLHNETLNIQTHLLPLLAIFSILPLAWKEFTQSLGLDIIPPLKLNIHPLLPEISSFAAPGLSIPPLSSLVPSLPFTPFPPSAADPLPKFLFLLAAAACLACSTVWHTLAGCSDLWILEAGARVDYVGIGWLISASVSGVMYYGFACQPAWMRFYISITIVTGLAGSILPFQGWFNERRNKKWRIAFFLLCACSAIIPLAHLSYKHTFGGMWGFIRPLVPSLVSYLVGLALYATHFPECYFPGRFDWGGSHAMWHVFIVIGEFARCPDWIVWVEVLGMTPVEWVGERAGG